MPFRFIHAADVHLDSPLRSLALRDADLADLIGNATRRAFVGIVDLCLEEAVDALVLSGDLYDGDQTSMKTARFLAAQMHRLHEAGIKVFIIRGNHDALSKITKELVMPETTRIFSGRADAVAIATPGGGPDVVVHGISFAQPHAPESLLAKYKPPVEGAVNIGLMHTSLGGAPGHDPYAPCAVADLEGSGFRYWALGHIHRRDVAGTRCSIVMPGMPQGRDIGEAGPKSATLVTVRDDQSVAVEARLTSVAQFERVSVDVGAATDWRDVVARIATALGRQRDAVASQHLIARLSITGVTPLAWRIRRDADLLVTEAKQRAAALGNSWIDKVEIDVAVPAARAREASAGALGEGALAELHRLVSEEVRTAPAYVAAVTAILEELRGQLPQECRHVVGDDEATLQATLARLAKAGSEDVLARLEAHGGGGDA